MLDAIASVAQFAFRRHSPWRRQELVDESIGYAFVMFCRLVERGKLHLAYPSPLAWYAVRRVRSDHQLGVRQSKKDVLSKFAQRHNGFSVRSLAERDRSGRWQDLVVEDRHASPADVASFRLDFAQWLRRLRSRSRKVALDLASGNRPMDTARRFGVSRPRIAQMRRELEANWHAFQNESMIA
jgi:hypothetical protein